MLRRIYEIRQFSPVLDRHWTNILIVGFLQVQVRVQSHHIDNVRRTSVTSGESSTRSRRAMQWLPEGISRTSVGMSMSTQWKNMPRDSNSPRGLDRNCTSEAARRSALITMGPTWTFLLNLRARLAILNQGITTSSQRGNRAFCNSAETGLKPMR